MTFRFAPNAIFENVIIGERRSIQVDSGFIRQVGVSTTVKGVRLDGGSVLPSFFHLGERVMVWRCTALQGKKAGNLFLQRFFLGTEDSYSFRIKLLPSPYGCRMNFFGRRLLPLHLGNSNRGRMFALPESGGLDLLFPGKRYSPSRKY